MRLLLLAVVMAQALDLATFSVMPRANEVNPIVAGLHTEAAWLAKALLVAVVVAIQPALRPRYPAVGEAVALLALAAGCIGAGSNIAVLSSVEASRPALYVPAAASAPSSVATGRTPAPSGVGTPSQPVVSPASVRPRPLVPCSRSVPAPDVPRGTTS